MDEILFVEEELPKEIGHLQKRLNVHSLVSTPRVQTTNSEQFHLYLKGRHFRHQRTEVALRKAISFFNQAIEIDPAFALAYAGLADCYSPHWTFLAPKDAFPKARAAAAKALEFDSQIVEAHAVLGAVELVFEWRLQQAEAELKRAIELNSNYPRAHQHYAELLTDLGESDRAANEAQRTIDLDPLSPAAYWASAQQRYYARQ